MNHFFTSSCSQKAFTPAICFVFCFFQFSDVKVERCLCPKLSQCSTKSFHHSSSQSPGLTSKSDKPFLLASSYAFYFTLFIIFYDILHVCCKIILNFDLVETLVRLVIILQKVSYCHNYDHENMMNTL